MVISGKRICRVGRLVKKDFHTFMFGQIFLNCLNVLQLDFIQASFYTLLKEIFFIEFENLCVRSWC